jgi:thymidine kinase
MIHQRGRIEVICGSMFSGKSEELLRRLRRATIAKQKIQVFKPSVDDRYGVDRVKSHDGRAIEAIAVEAPKGVLNGLDDDTTVVGIDEAQFFEEGIVSIIHQLVDRDIRVIIAGLDMDFRGEPFGPMPMLMAMADDVEKLHAICVVTGEPATHTQRLVNGKPAHYNDPVILVGAEETYEPRSRQCHEVPGRPW